MSLFRGFCAALCLAGRIHGGAEEGVSFRNDVMAVLAKAGCSAGTCHGNANGKAGFKLSLRGEDPELDFLALTHDQFGRRINVAEPGKSLILQKATTTLAHEGGQRFQSDSAEYRILEHWISAGAKDDLKSAPRVERLEVSPVEVTLVEPESTVQISARAVFSDGSSRDVSGMAVYEPSQPIVNVTPEGLVHREQFGETTVLVRYLEKQVPVRLAFIPERSNFEWSGPEPNNFIDRHVFAKLQQHRLNPSEICTDEAFVRRAFLDLLGVIPSAEEGRRFVLDPSPNKRSRLINELLLRPEFADFWALKWSDLLRNEERILDRKGSELFHQWVRQSILQHKPLDQFAREIVAARGSTYENPPANFYRATRKPVERGEAVAQLFLGTRMQCAQCHNHPFDRWTQDDYYEWMSVFSRLNYKVLENRRRDNNDGHEFKGEQIVFLKTKGEFKNARTGSAAKPRFLGAPKLVERTGDEDELRALGNWLTSPENPFFAKVQANRIWFHLMGRGVVDPIDDFRASNPPSHPELLEALAADFVQHGFDLRHVIRTIMNSRTYQLASMPNETNAEDETNFSHNVLRRLTAEQLLDCQSAALGVPVELEGYPRGTRAVQMAGALPERRRGRGNTDVVQFLAEFGKPPRLLPSECERSTEPTMGQAFQMMSGPVVQELLTAKENRIAKLLATERGAEEIIQELYWSTLTRAPSNEELKAFIQHLNEDSDKRAALEDILWSLVNSKEFLFRH